MRALVPVCLFLCTTAFAAPDTTRRLPRSTPEQQGISSAAILSFVEAADTGITTMNSFMLVRHGRVVAEGWWAPYGPDSPHMLYSLSKSFTSTAVGLAIAEGKLGLNDPVLRFFPEDAPADPSQNLRSMRVRDLLRMSAGHQTEVGLTPALPVPWTRAFLAHPVPFKPGTHFLYNTPATYMLSAIVQKVTGQTVFDYLRPRLFEPLGIEGPTWGSSPQGVSLGGYGLSIRTEDIARFGQLYLARGEWNGRQLIPREWVDSATARQTSNGSSPESDWDQGYGYQFWRSRHGYRGDGAFGQFCIVLPEQDAVVAITSGVRDMQAVMRLVWDKLLPAMGPAPLAESLAAQRRLTERLAHLAVRPVAGRANSPSAGALAGKWFDFPANDRGIQGVRLDLGGRPALVVRTAAGESRIPFGVGSWTRSRSSFLNGLERTGMAPGQPVAASGAWTGDDVLRIRLCFYETPHCTTLDFRVAGMRLLLDSEHNVAFGPTRLPQLVGERSR